MPYELWSGQMDWPLGPDWECEICGNKGLWVFVGKEPIPLTSALEWGLIHGVCRCIKCHAKYNMRDRDGQRVTKPISLLKAEYKAAAKAGWEPLRLPLDEWIDDMWTAALEWAKEAEMGSPDPTDNQLDRQQMAEMEPPHPFEQDPTNPCGAIDPRF